MSMTTKLKSLNEIESISTKIEESPQELIIFPWTMRWLKGYEYSHILQNYEMYHEGLGFEMLPNHPDWIYRKPQSKNIYLF